MKILYVPQDIVWAAVGAPTRAIDAVNRLIFEIRVTSATMDRLREGPPLNDHAVEWDRLRGRGYSEAETQEVIRRLGDAILLDAQAAVDNYRANLKRDQL